MGWDAVAFTRALTAAVESYDRTEAEQLCGDLVEQLATTGPILSLRDAMTVLRQLRRKQLFDLMGGVAEALLQSGLTAPCVRCEYAQALIERGMAAASIDLLEGARRDASSPAERAEAQGLLGRAYKQMAIRTRAPERHRELLSKAVSTYLDAYRRSPRTCAWHGVNAAALMVLSEREGSPVESGVRARDIAGQVIAEVEARFADPYAAVDPWDAAMAAEAQLVLGEMGAASQWVQRYSTDARADAFELSSTLRQLVEVWQLESGSEPGCRILPVLRGEILHRREGAGIELAPADVIGDCAPTAEDLALEKVLGSSGVVTHSWYRRGLAASRAVARIRHHNGRAVGTGFLIGAESLTGRSTGAPLLVTNNHVVAITPDADETLTPDQAEISFEVLAAEGSAKPSFRAKDVMWSSPPRELDTTVLTLDAPVEGVEPCTVTAARPRRDGKQRVYVIGHPAGRELSYSINDNVLLDYDDRVLHYRAPTEHGSSGSPVFNRDWDVVAVHHAGRSDMPRLRGRQGTYPANEGIWIEAVRRALSCG
jgi:V8-like Glu-specific endopeptidase